MKQLANISIDKLRDQTGNDLWLFPKKGDRYDDKIENQFLFELDGKVLTTNNIMGFVGCGDTELTIRSRFSNKDGNDWFMQYMLQKVFAINVFDLKHTKSTDESLDIAALMLPYFLQKALGQGLYREYISQDYNDSNLRGALDISRHIKENYPFRNGKIAYSTREFRYDNSITQLIRHTIEYIRTKKASATAILYSSPETQANIKQIVDATPTYRRSDLRRIMLANLKPKIHPYYSEYRPLQRLCMQILRGERISYGSDNERIHGVLFDGAWLWEEYLNLTFSKAGFQHPENRTGRGRIQVFRDRDRYPRYPDFMKENIIADAKYKVLLRDSRDLIYEYLSRDDLNQMITYLHITSSRKGIFVNPLNIRVMNPETGDYLPETAFCTRIGELHGDGGDIYIIGVNIPQSCNSYNEFAAFMGVNEKVLCEKLKEISLDGE
ncbi:MAG: hypothetical protein IKH93_06580 [Bacteroidales bacterium]|nr:hypothetical protein [Bacteroidales bacterium]